MIARNVRGIYAKCLAVCVAIGLANIALEMYLPARIREGTFRWAVAFIATQGCAVACLSIYLLALRAYGRLIDILHDHVRPPIRDRVLALVFAGESWSSNVPKHGPARRVLEGSVADALTTLKASARDRIAQFAIDQGFQTDWIKAFSSRSPTQRKRAICLLALISQVAGETVLPAALDDESAAVRAVAYRGLLILGNPKDVEKAFLSLMGESFLVRALLVNELKRHASFLLAGTIPRFLHASSSVELVHCFELLVAWETALPSFDLHPWIAAGSDHRLWPFVLALLPYVKTDDSLNSFVVAALRSDNLTVQCAAADAAGRLQLASSIAMLSAALSGEKQLAVASANAIAQMGERGQRKLEMIIAGQDREAAAFALEALERVTVKAR